MNLDGYELEITRFAVEITRYLVSRGSRLQDAEDVVQDTIVKLIELEIYIAPDKLRAWMYRVSIRAYINKYQRGKRYSAIIEQLGRELSDFKPAEATSSDLTELLQRLSSSDNQLLQAYYYENLSTKQLAVRFHSSLSKVKTDLYRARKRLRKILEEEGYEEWKI